MTTTEDKPVALITGAGRRVGRAVAVELARAGYDIVVHYNHSADDAERTAAMVGEHGRRAWRVGGGLQNPQTPARIIAEAYEQAGRIDVLINNASVFGKMPLEVFDVKKWHDTMQINLAAPIQLCQQGTRISDPTSHRGRDVALRHCPVCQEDCHHVVTCPSAS